MSKQVTVRERALKVRNAVAVLKQHARRGQCPRDVTCPECDELRAALLVLDNMNHNDVVEALTTALDDGGERPSTACKYCGLTMDQPDSYHYPCWLADRNTRARIVDLVKKHRGYDDKAEQVIQGQFDALIRSILKEGGDEI